jgi:hypothetical protein
MTNEISNGWCHVGCDFLIFCWDHCMLHTIHLVLKQQYTHESTRNEHPSTRSLISPPVTSCLSVKLLGRQGSQWLLGLLWLTATKLGKIPIWTLVGRVPWRTVHIINQIMRASVLLCFWPFERQNDWVWRTVTRFTQPHVHTYTFCPYVISTLYHLLEELQMRTFKRYFSCAILLTT